MPQLYDVIQSGYKNARSTIFAGRNSNTDDIYFNVTFGLSATSPNAAPTNIKFDTCAMFDSVIVFENNTCYVIF